MKQAARLSLAMALAITADMSLGLVSCAKTKDGAVSGQTKPVQQTKKD